MTLFFWTHLLWTLLASLLLLVTLPLVLELALVTSANWLPAKRSSANPGLPPGSPSNSGFLAIIVPAHDEEGLIVRCVTSLKASADPQTRIFVIAHNCKDATAERARAAGAEVLVYDNPDAKGKGFALRYGFDYALRQGALAVMVVDADSVVSSNTLPEVQNALFLPGGPQARIVQCRYEMESTTERSGTQLAVLAVRGFNVIRPRGRGRLGLSCGILGNGFAILRPVLEAIPYEAFSVVEDLEYHLHLVMAGERVLYLDNTLVSASFPESKSGESIQRSRWEGGRLRTAQVLALPLLSRVLGGNFRLLEPFLDLTGLPLAYGVFFLLFALIPPLGWLRWYAAGSLGVILAHVLTAAAAGPDFLKTMRLLALAPLYILRKLLMIPGVLRGSSSKAAWIRTERDNTL